MQSPPHWHQSLAARSGVVFVLFVIAGSTLLLAWLRHQQEEESARVFITLAETDANFVRRLNLPRSARLAQDLQQLLGMEIYFRDSAGEFQPPLPELHRDLLSRAPARAEVYSLPNRREALIVRMDEKHDMIFIRAAAAPTLTLLHPATLSALFTFALLSALLAWVIAGQVLRPLGALTRRLPGFFASSVQPPEMVRRDEIGQLARALTQARDELAAERVKREQSERLALLGRVATGLAHDIKNPLASIQLHAELTEPAGGDPESAASIGLIRAEAKVIEGLVNQWLYLARPASPRLGTVDIRSTLAQAIQSVRGQADHASVSLEGPEPGEAVSIQGDRSRLEQAFRNVLVNAIQAMSSGGVLRAALTQDSEVNVVFEDTGPGFSATALERGTDLFYSEKEGGMGVGLNVVSEIISAHDGRMMLKNRPSGGARVELSLPLGSSPPHSLPSL